MRVLLLQLDGKIPNLALMRLAAHHRAKGDEVVLQQARNVASVERGLWDDWDLVYASAIFTKSASIARRLLEVFPAARIGGTGWDLGKPAGERMTLERLKVTARPDYSDYPGFPHSLGYTQRGCRLACNFCDVSKAEGKVTAADGIESIYRGEPHPRNLLLLDNDFFGQPAWRERVAEMDAGRFRVCFNQGINLRMLTAEQAAALASVDYRDDSFKTRRLYAAWDNRDDEGPLFRGLELLKANGVRPDDILVYMLVGFWGGPHLGAGDFYRHRRLREFGCRPYPMPYQRTRELIGFQRWVVKRIDCVVPWEAFKAAGYRPERFGLDDGPSLFAE